MSVASRARERVRDERESQRATRPQPTPTVDPKPAEPYTAKPRHGIVKVPLSYFTKMLSEFAIPCDRVIFGLVLEQTIGLAARGRMKARTWAPITPKQIADIARVDPEWASERLNTLVSQGLILERHDKSAGGKLDWEYSIAPEVSKETRGEKVHGRCAECKVIGQFTLGFIPMPLEYFTVLTPGLGNAALLAVAVIGRFSHEGAWSTETGLVPKWTELDLTQFERLTELDKRQIENGIAEAESKGCIEVQRKKGKVNAYRTLPENWSTLEKRGLRIVEQPIKPRKPKGESAPRTPKTPANPTEETKSSPVTVGHGWCVVCSHITEIQAVTAEEEAQEREKQQETAVETINRPPRAGPTRAQSLIVNEPFSRVPKWKGLS